MSRNQSISRSSVLKFLTAVVFSFSVGVLILFLASYDREGLEDDIGIKAVKYMYQFTTIAELDANMEGLKLITSDEVYNYLTFDRTDKALNVYLKFHNKPVFVNIEDTGPGFVIYTLNTESISADRRFVFFFKVKSGKIVYAREGEFLDFNDTLPTS